MSAGLNPFAVSWFIPEPEPSSLGRLIRGQALVRSLAAAGRAVNLIIILVIGAIVGWLAGMIMRSGGGILFDIVVGIAGALLAGYLFGGGASIINAPLTSWRYSTR
jgi:uncharacterized membrane protein YeaQ/YmgE (transglycosylase-associated protein family)